MGRSLTTGTHRPVLDLPAGSGPRTAALAARAAAVVLLALTGAIHVHEAPSHLQLQAYVGILFGVDAAGAFLAALGVAAGVRGAWLLGVAATAAPFAGLLLAASVGLPRFTESLSTQLAVPALLVEGAYLLLYAAVAAGRRSAAAA